MEKGAQVASAWAFELHQRSSTSTAHTKIVHWGASVQHFLEPDLLERQVCYKSPQARIFELQLGDPRSLGSPCLLFGRSRMC
jgi:hypothetical protein